MTNDCVEQRAKWHLGKNEVDHKGNKEMYSQRQVLRAGDEIIFGSNQLSKLNVTILPTRQIRQHSTHVGLQMKYQWHNHWHVKKVRSKGQWVIALFTIDIRHPWHDCNCKWQFAQTGHVRQMFVSFLLFLSLWSIVSKVKSDSSNCIFVDTVFSFVCHFHFDRNRFSSAPGGGRFFRPNFGRPKIFRQLEEDLEYKRAVILLLL